MRIPFQGSTRNNKQTSDDNGAQENKHGSPGNKEVRGAAFSSAGSHIPSWPLVPGKGKVGITLPAGNSIWTDFKVNDMAVKDCACLDFRA